MNKHYRNLMAWPAALLFAMMPVSFAAAARMPSSAVSYAAGTGRAVLGDLDVKVLDPAVRTFIEQYCVLQSIQLDQNGTESSVSRFYTEATRANAAMLAESRTVYESLSPSVQQQIQTICLEHGMNYDAISQKACALMEEEKASASKEAQNAGSVQEQPDQTANPGQKSSEAIEPDEQAGDFSNDLKAYSDPALIGQPEEENKEKIEEKKQEENPNTADASNPSLQNEADPKDQSASSTERLAALPDGTIISAAWVSLDETVLKEQQALLSGCKELAAFQNAGIVQIIFTASLGEQKAVQTVYGLQTDAGNTLYSLINGENGQPQAIQTYDPAYYSYDFNSGEFALQPGPVYALAAENTKPEKEPDKNEMPETAETKQPSDSVFDELNTDEKKSAEQKIEEETEQKTLPDENSVQNAWQDAKADKNKAQSFVDRYCTANGSVIKKADQSNAQTILDGYESWSAMSQSEKNAVNKLLKSAGSVSFQSLYTQANEIRLGLPATSVDEDAPDDARPQKPAPVQTGWMSAGTLASLSAAGAAAGMLLLSAGRKQDSADHQK